MNIHQDIEEWMAGALMGALGAEEQSQFERHLAECAECRALYREEQNMNTILEKQFAKDRPDPGFDERMVRNFRGRVGGARAYGAAFWHGLVRVAQSRPMQAAVAVLLVAAMVKTGTVLTGERMPGRLPSFAAAGEMSRAKTREITLDGYAGGAMKEAKEAAAADDGKLQDSSASVNATGEAMPAPTPTSEVLPGHLARRSFDALDKAISYSGKTIVSAGALEEKGKDVSNGTLAMGGMAAQAPAGAMMPEALATVNPDAAPAPAQVQDIGRKLIRNANASYEVADFTKAADRVTSLVNASQGYIATQNSDRGENGKLEGQIVVKVPPPALDNFLLQLRALGDLKGQTVGTQDVTKDYFDTDARMHNAQAEEARLLDILDKKTGRLSDVLEVEREVARVRESIEQMQGTLKYYDTMAQFATVTIALAEKDLNQTAQYLLKQKADLSIFAADVESTLAKAKAEAAAVKAQTLDSNLQRDAQGNATATLNLLIDPAHADEAIAQLKSLGRIQTYQSHTERVAHDGGAQPSTTATTDKDNVELNLTIQQDQETSVQQTDLALATKDVEAKIAQLKKDAAAAGAEVKGASFQRDPSGGESGEVELRTEVKDYPRVLAAAEALGEVKSLSVNRQETASATDTAPAEISVRLSEPGQIVAPENGLWATIRRTLGEAFEGLMWSVRMIGVSLAFFAPWAIALAGVIWVGRLLLRRRK